MLEIPLNFKVYPAYHIAAKEIDFVSEQSLWYIISLWESECDNSLMRPEFMDTQILEDKTSKQRESLKLDRFFHTSRPLLPDGDYNTFVNLNICVNNLTLNG